MMRVNLGGSWSKKFTCASIYEVVLEGRLTLTGRRRLRVGEDFAAVAHAMSSWSAIFTLLLRGDRNYGGKTAGRKCDTGRKCVDKG